MPDFCRKSISWLATPYLATFMTRFELQRDCDVKICVIKKALKKC
jgi:hypothetical protein